MELIKIRRRQRFFKRYHSKEILNIVIILLLIFINIASLNVLIPSYDVIRTDLGISESLMFLPDSLSVLLSALSMILWGYFTDKINRNKVIQLGTFCSIIGFGISLITTRYYQLMLARIITGIGIGFVIPVGYSIMSDIIRPEERSRMFGFLTIFSSISNGIGQGLSGFIAPLNIFNLSWRFPFFVLICFSIIVMFLLILIKLPEVGSTEETLRKFQEYEDLQYDYRIERKSLGFILKHPTNRSLILNGFFYIVPGTILIFSLISTFSDANIGMFRIIPDEIRIQVSTIFAAMTSIGYLIGSAVLSRLGDRLHRKFDRGRAILALICNLLAIPLMLLMISQIVPIQQEALPQYPPDILDSELAVYVVRSVKAIFQSYPEYWLFLTLSFLSTFFASGMVTNKSAVMVDVNLPEHRGTATSFFQLTEQLGKSITLMLAAGILSWLGSYKKMIVFGVLFWIPSVFLWLLAVKRVSTDIKKKEKVLKARADYSFSANFPEIEAAMNLGIQSIRKITECIIINPKKAERLFDKAINSFIWIISQAHMKALKDIQEKTTELLNKTIKLNDQFAELAYPYSRIELEDFARKIEGEFQEIKENT